MKKEKNGVTIIGGADGPTSVFIAGHSKKRPLKIRLKQYRYRRKRKKAESRLSPGAHSIDEVIEYAVTKYNAVEIDATQYRYIEGRNNLKESLIIRHKPELLGEFAEIRKPEAFDEAAIKELHSRIERRSELARSIPDRELPMDYHTYIIEVCGGCLEIETDYIWDIMGISYSGNKKAMKYLRKTAIDLYLYYGVTKEDIANKTERYSSLLTTLST